MEATLRVDYAERRVELALEGGAVVAIPEARWVELCSALGVDLSALMAEPALSRRGRMRPLSRKRHFALVSLCLLSGRSFEEVGFDPLARAQG